MIPKRPAVKLVRFGSCRGRRRARCHWRRDFRRTRRSKPFLATLYEVCLRTLALNVLFEVAGAISSASVRSWTGCVSGWVAPTKSWCAAQASRYTVFCKRLRAMTSNEKSVKKPYGEKAPCGLS